VYVRRGREVKFDGRPRRDGDRFAAGWAYSGSLARSYNAAVAIDPGIPATIRPFLPKDQAACIALYTEGLLAGGQIAPNDTGYDVDHIQDVYMKCPHSHFWVAESPSCQIVGMIGVQHDGDGAAQIRRLRVRGDVQRRGIGTALLETALRFCQAKHYLKVMLDTYVHRESALRLFERFGFRLDRTRNVGRKELAYFYLDLYATGGRPDDAVDAEAPDPSAGLAE
jgi:ribosomal protein S18 acetylase RimI-like enzyme